MSCVLIIFGIHKLSPPPSSESYQSMSNSFVSTQTFVASWAGRSRQSQAWWSPQGFYSIGSSSHANQPRWKRAENGESKHRARTGFYSLFKVFFIVSIRVYSSPSVIPDSSLLEMRQRHLSFRLSPSAHVMEFCYENRKFCLLCEAL